MKFDTKPFPPFGTKICSDIICSEKRTVFPRVQFEENCELCGIDNVQQKIVSRIKIVSPNSIHHNQTGYNKDCFIGETIRSLYNVMMLTF